MAGDWLKLEHTLPEKPEVWQIASILGLDADSVVGKLFKVWRWFDQHTETGNAHSVTFALVDSVAGVTGFAEAMSFAGWLVQDGKDLAIPHFDRHNGKTAKNRALTAKRVAKSKEKSNADSVSKVTVPALPREEKRREEEKQKHGASAPSASALLPEVPAPILADFLKIRKAKRAPLTVTAVEGLRREAAKAGLSIEAAIRICCERSWQAFNASWDWQATGSSAGQPSAPAHNPGGVSPKITGEEARRREREALALMQKQLGELGHG